METFLKEKMLSNLLYGYFAILFILGFVNTKCFPLLGRFGPMFKKNETTYLAEYPAFFPTGYPAAVSQSGM